MTDTRGVRVEARGWGWRHASRADWTLRGLDLVIEPGERVLLLGPSGTGKSTLIHAMAGLTGPESAVTGDEEGSLLVAGLPPRVARGRTALVAQDPHTQIVMARAGDDVAFGLENRAIPADGIWPRVDAALDAVGFPYGRSRSTTALSGGEKQRLVVAGALALTPGLLLLDEPTANLDPVGAAAVRSLIADLAPAGTTLVLVEHRVAEIVDLVDRAVVIESGGVVADGPPDRIFTERGAELAARGVWVPGHEPGRRAAGGVLAPATAAATPAATAAAETLVRAAGVGEEPFPAEPYDATGPDDTAGPDETGGPGNAGHTGRAGGTGPLTDIDLDLTAGTATAISGPNGAGKSTLLALLAGLARARHGTVTPRGRLADVDPRPLAAWPARRLARHVGTVFQNAEHQFVRPSVRAELRLGPLLAGAGEAAAGRRADTLLDRLRLAHLADAHPFTLSGGEKRRLSVATALATEPDVLILDEPTFGQDARTWAELVALMAELRDGGRALAIATHDDRLLTCLADRVVELEAGRITGVHRPGPAAERRTARGTVP
jgi:energy-coupling factor transport system ATP-binding protein